MKISSVKLHLCSVCINRSVCLPEKQYPILNIAPEKFDHRDFLFFKKGAFIFKEGEASEGIFCIYHGSVNIYHDSHSNEAVDGDFIGFNSIVDKHFINSAECMDDTFCCFISTSEVQHLIDDEPSVAQKILAGF